jgi:hypothetical protein
VVVNGIDGTTESATPSTDTGARTPVLTGLEAQGASAGVGAAPSSEATKEELTSALTEQLSNPPDSVPVELENTDEAIEEAVEEVRRREEDAAAHLEAVEDQPTSSHDPVLDLTDDLDPLGIGDVKDRAPVSRNREKVRAQMEILMQ